MPQLIPIIEPVLDHGMHSCCSVLGILAPESAQVVEVWILPDVYRGRMGEGESEVGEEMERVLRAEMRRWKSIARDGGR